MSVLKDQPYKHETAGTCKQKGRRNSEMKDAWKKVLAHGGSGKKTANYEEESIFSSAKTVCNHIAQRLIQSRSYCVLYSHCKATNSKC